MNTCRLIPAIDLINGRCVRLKRGDFNHSELVGEDPVSVAQQFEKAGFRRLHIVDLDGARLASPQHLELVHTIARTSTLNIDFSGGLRSEKDIERAFNRGVSAVVLGSAAVLNPDLLRQAILRWGAEAVILGLDVLNGEVRIKGWSEGTDLSVDMLLEKFSGSGLKRIMSTDISRDGMLEGPAFELYAGLLERFPEFDWIASGGVASDEDVLKLAATGVKEIIVGKALYSAALNLSNLAQFIC